MLAHLGTPFGGQKVDFQFCGFDRVHARKSFRCYIVVERDSYSESAVLTLARDPGFQYLSLKPASMENAEATLRRNRFPRDGTYTVYCYFTPINRRLRYQRQTEVYEQITWISHQLKRQQKGRRMAMTVAH